MYEGHVKLLIQGVKIAHSFLDVMSKAMFTLYRIVKRSVAESVPDRASLFTLGVLLSKQFLLRNVTAPHRC